MDWRFHIQWRGPFSHIMYPDSDCDLNRSKCSGGLDRLGSDAPWGTQLASVIAHILFGGREKLRKLDISFYCCVLNIIPRDLHTFRYFSTYRANATCDRVAQCRCCANIFVMVAISMRVSQASQLRDPTTDWSCSCAACSIQGEGGSADRILYTGNPNLQGLWKLFVYSSPSSPASALILASYDR